MLMFECSEEVMVGRLMERGQTSGRVDDNEETIRKRLHTFQQSTLLVIEHYQAIGKVKKVYTLNLSSQCLLLANNGLEKVCVDMRVLLHPISLHLSIIYAPTD